MSNPKYVAAHGNDDVYGRQPQTGLYGVGLLERNKDGVYIQKAIFQDSGLAVLTAGLLSNEAAALEATAPSRPAATVVKAAGRPVP